MESKINRDEIKAKIQIILNKAHTIPQKKVIVEDHDGLNFADPIGGDSKKNPNTKRCHLYWNSFYVVSYDDEGYKMPFTQFCKKFGVDIDADQRIAIYDHIDNNLTYQDLEDDFIETKFDKLIELDDMLECFNSQKTDCPIVNMKPIQKGGWAEYYLNKRGIPSFLHRDIYQGEFYRNSEWKDKVIIYLNRKGGKVLGIQVRNLKDSKWRMFMIYNFEQLNRWIYPEREISDNHLVLYNKLSYFFNILNINFESKITVFEGYLDSLFCPNSIGIVGVNTDLRFLENNNLDVQYFFDNDKAGFRKSEEKIKAGYPVFLWKKLFEDIVEKKKTKDPYSLLHRVSKVKDMNKLAEVVKNPWKELELWNYFSKDEFDLRYIPKFKKKWVTYKKYNSRD